MTVHHFTFHITDKVMPVISGKSKPAHLASAKNRFSGLFTWGWKRAPRVIAATRYEGKAVGHILFTRATFKGKWIHRWCTSSLPWRSYRNTKDGRGRTVDTHWHRAPEVDGRQTVFVLGHATYYPRHGFEPVPETKAIRHLIPSRRSTKPADDAITHRSAHDPDRPHPVREALMKPEHWRE